MREPVQPQSRYYSRVCCGRRNSHGSFAAAKALGRAIPKVLSVVGFDDTDYALEMKPSLTTIHVPYEDMARRAVEILSDLIKTGIGEKVCLPAPLVVRKSAGKVPAPSKHAAKKT